jgi:septal ring factor EnvC (AmiA/AmiB activator)
VKNLKAKFTLAAILVVLMSSLAVNTYFCTKENSLASDNIWLQKKVADLQSQLVNAQEQVNGLQSEKKSLQNQLASIENQKSNLENQIGNLHNQVNNLQNDNSNLQRANENLKSQLYYPREPQLITRLGVSDVLYNPRYTGNSRIPRLFIQGEVWNAGDKTAYSCRLYVTLYQDDVVANYSTIELGTIEPWSFVSVSTNIHYEGAQLTSWTIIPQFG